MSLSTAAKARLKREFILLQKDPPPGIRAKPNGSNGNDGADPTQLTHWTATVIGPRDSPFVGVCFSIQIDIPPRYPMEPPSCQFAGPLIPYHPNIDSSGRICLDTLKRPPSGTWSPAVSLTSLLLSLQILLAEPNAEDGLMPEISKLYQTSPDEWHKEARRRILLEEQKEQQQNCEKKRGMQALEKADQEESLSTKRQKA
jgi:ubiquitin-conjugating enzyme E2 T